MTSGNNERNAERLDRMTLGQYTLCARILATRRRYPAPVRNRVTVNRAALALLLITIALVASGCGGYARRAQQRPGQVVVVATPVATIPVVIEVFGTSGLKFGGSYGELGGPKTLEGTVPVRLTFKTLAGFSIAFQKRAQDGELGMAVSVDGKEVSRSQTVKPFGVVTYMHQITPK
jgi:hypothetical protein